MPKSKEQKQKEALERQSKVVSSEDRLKHLDSLGLTAKKERNKLQKRIENAKQEQK